MTEDARSPVVGLYEMVLEVADLAAAETFYGEVLGLPVVNRWGKERPAVWFGLGNGGFLGLWPAESGGKVAIHQGRGGAHVHFALRVPRGTLDALQARLESLEYVVEPYRFADGNRDIYIDDPDGNVVELTELVRMWDGTPVNEP